MSIKEKIGAILLSIVFAAVLYGLIVLAAAADLPQEYAASDLNRDGEINLTDWSIFNAEYPYGN